MKKETIKTAMWLVAAATINISSITKAQNVGINANGVAPNNSAMLDVDVSSLPNNNKKGLLIPRVSLTSNTDVTTIPSPANSLVVYNTNASMTNGNGAGFYYWDAGAGKWIYMASPANGPGNAGQVLTSQGSGNPPQWSTLSVSGGCAGSVQMISNVSSTTMTWRNCVNYCATLTEGGYSDWRMPTTQDIVSYMSNWDNVKNSSGAFLTSQPAYAAYIWVGEFYYPSIGNWVIFDESSGHWTNVTYNIIYYCRCVR